MQRLVAPGRIAAALAATAAIAGLLGACSESDLELSGAGSAMGEEGDARSRGPSGPRVTDPDDVVELALADVTSFWEDTLPKVYDMDFEPLAGGYVPYGPRSDVPACGPEELGYDDVAENAFYCPLDDYVAWDRVNLIPQLQAQYGGLTTGIVMAHEFGHAIQVRAGVSGRTVTLELQADCFAGAWLADADDRVATFSTLGDALDQAMAGLLELRDALGVSGNNPQAHGSGFDRVGAFQEGFEQGADVCTTYETDPPEVVAIPFGSPADARAGGNLPLDQLLEPLRADLESFFSALFAEAGRSWTPIGDIVPFDPAIDSIDCSGDVLEGTDLDFASFYCTGSNTIYIDAAGLVPALEEIGDFAFGGEIARLYAFAAQTQLGYAENTADTDLHADCLVGVYAGAEFLQTIPDQQLVLSPGDLDEIIIAFLAFGSEGRATAFQRTAAFRSGFTGGPDACGPLLDQ